MTGLDQATPGARLRYAAERAPGKKVVVDVVDLTALLFDHATRAPVVDLDALTGHTPPDPAPALEQASAAPAARAPQSDRIVVLPVTGDGAHRLAEAAWNTTAHLVDAHGRWDGPGAPLAKVATVEAARRALAALAAHRDR